MKLDILVLPTYNTYTLGIVDNSTYDNNPPQVMSPTIEIDVPNFSKVILPFKVNDFNVYNTTSLGITALNENQPLPDGIYHFKYSVAPSFQNFVQKTIIRVEQLQEKYDAAFMKLDLMECDGAIKTQSKVTLSTISFFIQGAIAAANNCATTEANKLYLKADQMLNNFTKNNCGCTGTNYKVNFYQS